MFSSRDVGEFGGTTTRRRATRTRTLGEEGHDDHRYGIIDRAITAPRGDEEGKEEGRRGGGGLPKRFEMGRKSRAKSERKARGTQIRSEGETETRSFTRFAVEEVSIGYDYSRCKFRETVETPAGFLQKTSMEIIRVGSEERTAEREFERGGDEVFVVLEVDVNDESDDAIQLTREFIERLPLVRGSRVMKMVLEGDIPNGVSPRLEIPAEYLDDDLIGESFSSSGRRSSISSSSSSSSSSSKNIRKEFPRYKSCAVVGTSGSLKDKALGEQIDKHEAVIRIDLGRTVGFERDVGARTTFDFAAANDLAQRFQTKCLRRS